MANVIIGIHGLGNKPSKDVLKEWWEMAMVEGLHAHGYPYKLPKFELVYWADILHAKPLSISEHDRDNMYYLDEPYVGAPEVFSKESHETRKKIVDFVGKQLNRIFLNEDLSLNHGSLTDAILRRYFRDLDVYYQEDSKTKVRINQRLQAMLERYQGYNIMLISHSMGSIVAYEVLNFDAPQLKINSLLTIGSPLGLPVVVSKIAAEQRNLGVEVLQLKTPSAVKKHWYNFADILDYVAFDYCLADNFEENDQGVKPIDSFVDNNYEINGKRNPHKSFGYLRTLEFSEVLNRFILSEDLSFRQKIRKRTIRLIDRIKTEILK